MDQDQNGLGSGAAGDRTRHANGTPGEAENRWYRSVVENSTEVVSIVDPDGTLRYASPSWKRVLGYDPVEVVGKHVLDHVHPDDLPRVLEATEEALSQPGVGRNVAEYRRKHKDGSWRWVESVGTYLIEDPDVRGVVVHTRDVTDRKEAEEALRRSEERFRSLVQNASDIITVLEADGTVRYVSPAVEWVTGYRPEEQTGTNAFDSVHPKDRERALALFAGVLETPGVHLPIEFRVPHKDGSWRYQEHVVNNLLDDPSVNGVVVTSRDVTVRKEAEEARREAEERYRTLVETVPAVTYTDRAVGSYPDMAIYTSPQIETLVGYSVEEWLEPERNLWEERLHPEDRAWVLAADERSRATGEPFAEEYRLIAKDGRMVWVRDEAALMRNEAGEPLYWQGVLVDVTERKKAEDALRHSERHFRALTQNSSDIITLLRATGTIRYQSPSIERILGYGPEETIEDNAFDYVHPDDRERVEMAFAEGLVDPRRRPSVEYRFRHKDGSWVWLESEGTNLLDDPEVGEYVVNSRDVTERKGAEERLREAEERYRTFVERVPAVTYVQQPTTSGAVTYVSPQMKALLGYEPEEYTSHPEHWRKIIHPEDLERALAENRRVNETGEPFSMEYRQFTKDGSVVWVRDEATLVRDERGQPLYWLGVQTDVTERKALEQRLEHQALHDSLTGLPNRRLFVDRLEQALRRTRRRKGRRVAVLFMDLDEFKVVNDSLGHEAGDLLLVVLAQRLRRCLRPEDTLARFGGDEFVVLLEDVEDPGEAVRVAERITDELRRPFELEGRELYATASIGVSWGDARTKSPDDLLRDADTAMYQAKRDGSGYRVFDPAMYERAVQRLDLENDLRRAVEAGEFVVHYQPIFDFDSREPWGVEALVRWKHPEMGLLCPSEFVPLAEETGLIVPIGSWVLEEACRQTMAWQDSHPRNPQLGVIVNLSAKQLRHPDCEETIREALAKSGLAAGSLGLDVTESAFIDALEANRLALERIQALGVRISIDDFGMGYSSLSYLKRLPADALKIDKSFVRGFGEDAEDTAIVRMVIDVAHTLGLEVVAEGVETWAQAALLAETGCDMAQGFHFAEPLPPEAASEFLYSTHQSSVPRNDADSLSDS